MNINQRDIAASRQIAVTARYAAATLAEAAAEDEHAMQMLRSPPRAQDAKPLKLRPIVAGMLAAGYGAHVDRNPATQTRYVLAVPTGGARNNKTALSLEQQREVYEAAEAKRVRKQQARVILAGDSTAEEF